MRKEYSTKPNKCPKCGSTRIAKILYGMPAFSNKLESEINAGRVILGGCCISDDDPTWLVSAASSTIAQIG